MRDDLTDRRVLVTGSTQGIGLAIAEAFCRAGARVAIHGLCDADQINTRISSLKGAGAREVRYFGEDLRNPDCIEAMMDAIDNWGGLDILVNNAGVQQPSRLETAQREAWDWILAVNLSAAFHTMRRSLPLMGRRGYGRVINIASVHGLVGSVEKGPYVASKHGLVGLTKVAALEYAHVGSSETGGVTVNCICPGWTETSLLTPQIEQRERVLECGRDDAIADLLAEKQPSRRMSMPSEIGRLALFLCHPDAHNITGAAFPIDGGWTSQ